MVFKRNSRCPPPFQRHRSAIEQITIIWLSMIVQQNKNIVSRYQLGGGGSPPLQERKGCPPPSPKQSSIIKQIKYTCIIHKCSPIGIWFPSFQTGGWFPSFLQVLSNRSNPTCIIHYDFQKKHGLPLSNRRRMTNFSSGQRGMSTSLPKAQQYCHADQMYFVLFVIVLHKYVGFPLLEIRREWSPPLRSTVKENAQQIKPPRFHCYAFGRVVVIPSLRGEGDGPPFF